jgi:hypothetical protein
VFITCYFRFPRHSWRQFSVGTITEITVRSSAICSVFYVIGLLCASHAVTLPRLNIFYLLLPFVLSSPPPDFSGCRQYLHTAMSFFLYMYTFNIYLIYSFLHFALNSCYLDFCDWLQRPTAGTPRLGHVAVDHGRPAKWSPYWLSCLRPDKEHFN